MIIKQTKRHSRFLNIAAKNAMESTFDRFRHGAVLVKGGSVISTATNKNQYCSFANRFRTLPGIPTIHAELGCILGIAREITNNAILYVVRIGFDNTFRLSKPCEMCEQCLSFVGVRRVYYSTNENEIGVMKL